MRKNYSKHETIKFIGSKNNGFTAYQLQHVCQTIPLTSIIYKFGDSIYRHANLLKWETRSVKGAEEEGEWGEGIPPQPTRGPGGAL